ncbi:DNA ligase [sediment metagenome]|uniref:DNA ligase n=1 Tax=sediment metagenome TaxID=749907 RepID=D9PN51_9ZZZZ
MKKLTTFLLFLLFPFSTNANPPPIQLANIYHSNIDLKNYFVSEKLDGLRAYFDGKNLISREGNIYNAPKWFIEDFPNQIFEGELWIGRGKFEEVSGIVRNESDDNQEWQKIYLMVFDLPKHSGTFEERLQAMQDLVEKSRSKYLRVIEQSKITDQKTLMKRLDEVVKNGGEGLMLRRADSLYQAKRSDDLLKLKTFEDAEAKVLAIIEGKGKYQKMMGALLVENEERIKFKIGGGFSDEMRENPPPIGTIVTYKYYGKTKDNKPRFASFLRVREDYNFSYR